jgi:uncharacterized membrane protein
MPERGSPLGPDPRLAMLLAYAGGWVSGSAVWLVERDRPDVRLHALQSILAFGSATLIWAALWVGSFAVLVVSATGFFVLQRLAQAVLAAAVVAWVYCLWTTARGNTPRLPYFWNLTSRRSSPPAPEPPI